MSPRHSTLILAIIALFAFGSAHDAFARAGGGGSFGSRGSRTFSAPPSTNTAPSVSPLNRTMSPSPNDNVFRSGARQSSGFFGGGFGRGLLGGLLGAGLFGLMFGHGLFGGLGGGLSIIGLVVQLGLLYLLFRLVMGFIRGRQPAFQTAAFSPGPIQGGPAPGGFGGGAARTSPLAPQPADFDTFERRLGEIQAAYGKEDLDAIRRLSSPEMASYFAEEIAGNARKGQVNHLSDVKLLSGDLSEAWREPDAEYATVAMRYSLLDTMVDRASGRVVAGDATTPQVVTEIWTFARAPGAGVGDWKVAAIQQA